ncbi:hypothetical protein GCM10025867_21840 [Frondihabitans sucicola]|uniref:ABC transporter domain-containing protein n=1 Tax=Frondihabitans sucicola TaxID=1268041 RepID=A0ABM8GND2_9MICO|nr:hypothetical protein GCM10025867_21840 [Frondihabitans sucicola]
MLGASGAGKSTLLAGLAGVLGGDEEGDDTGELLVDGGHPADQRGRVGLVLQDPDSQVVLARVGDDVAFGPENLGVPRDEIWDRVGSSLEAVGLQLPLDASTSELSGGQKQRLALAGALAMRPGLLLLDEPTANLDPAGVQEVRDSVARVVDETGATLVVVEHRVSVWLPLVDRVIVLAASGASSPTGVPIACSPSRPTRCRRQASGFRGEHPSCRPGPDARLATEPFSTRSSSAWVAVGACRSLTASARGSSRAGPSPSPARTARASRPWR